MERAYYDLAEKLKALAECTRIKILNILSKEEMCVCEIIDQLHLSQPAVSHHLKILKLANLIVDRKEGKWVFYSLNRDEYETLIKQLKENIPKENRKIKDVPNIICDESPELD